MLHCHSASSDDTCRSGGTWVGPVLHVALPLQKMILRSLAPRPEAKQLFCAGDRTLKILVAAEESPGGPPLQSVLRESGLQDWPGVQVHFTGEKAAVVEMSTARAAGGQGLTTLQCCAVIRVGVGFWWVRLRALMNEWMFLLLFCCQFLREVLPPSVLITRDPLTSVDLLSDLAAALRRECRLLSEAVRETIAVG